MTLFSSSTTNFQVSSFITIYNQREQVTYSEVTLILFFCIRIMTEFFQPIFFAYFANVLREKCYRFGTKNPTHFGISEKKVKKITPKCQFFSRPVHFQLIGGIVDQRIVGVTKLYKIQPSVLGANALSG